MAGIVRTIKFEADLDQKFGAWIESIPGGEGLHRCIQCGTCSATCPLSIFMDYTPRRLINMARAGFRKEVLGSMTPWLCASCYSCTVDCPQLIKVTDIMYALKRQALLEGVTPRGLPVSVLAREFYRMVRYLGRTTESYLVVVLFLKTSLLKLIGMGPLGLKLFLTGRMCLLPESVRNRGQVRAILDNVRKADAPRKVPTP